MLGVETQHSLQTTESCDHLTLAIIKLESERDLPKLELPIFSGQAILWPRFIEQFHSQIHCRLCITDTRRMDILQSHLRGEAKHLVSGLGYSGKNYAEALKELKRAFGHKIKVARAFLNTVTVGPPVAPRDAQAIRRFYVALRDCETTLQQLNFSSDLYSYDNVLKVRGPFVETFCIEKDSYIDAI